MSQSCRNRGISGAYRAGEVGAESASTECEVYINHSIASGIVYQLTNHLSPAIIKHSRNQTIVNRIERESERERERHREHGPLLVSSICDQFAADTEPQPGRNCLRTWYERYL